MALTRAPQGGGDGLDFDDVKQAMQALAKAGDLVVFRVLEVHEPVQMTGEVHPVTADMVVCSGKSKGTSAGASPARSARPRPGATARSRPAWNSSPVCRSGSRPRPRAMPTTP
jgi:hypothetical protein